MKSPGTVLPPPALTAALKSDPADIKRWPANAADVLPGGYQAIKDKFQDGPIVYRFKPGETLGMAFDGLIHGKGKWRLFPKPWRAAE